MDKEDLKKRTKEFAHRCVKLAMNLPETPLGGPIRDQLIRAATSVAANYRAACLAQSKASFAAKLSIVLEEVDKSAFWMKFSMEERIVNPELVQSLLNEADKHTSIFISSRKTIQIKKKK